MMQEFEKAISDFDEAIRLNPKLALAYHQRGLAWGESREYDKAITDFNEAIRLTPQYFDNYIYRGHAWVAKSQFDKAIADFSKAINLNPQDARAYQSRAFAWYATRDYDKAIADYDQAVRLIPGDDTTYDGRGWAWQNKRDFDKAIADFTEAIRLDPKGMRHYFGRAFALFLSNRAGVANDVKTALDLGWREPLSFYAALLGHFSARRLAQGDQARSFLNDAATRCTVSDWPYPIVKYLRGEIDEAKLLAAAIDNDKLTEAHCYVALNLLQDGQKDSALTHARWVRDHGNPRFLEHAIALAELDRLNGR